jgi:lipopolysaccharide transport system permease protein
MLPLIKAMPASSRLPVIDAIRLIWQYRRILASTTRSEIAKKHAASFLGMAWAVLHPLLFLGMYAFLYLGILKIRLPEFSEFGFVLFVFSGLVPYLAFMEVANTAAVAVKQNIHLVKNVMLPIDLVPVRVALIALTTEVIALGILVAILLVSGELSLNLPLLVIALFIQAVFLIGIAFFLAALGVLVPDVSYFINLLTIFLLFVSPIAFRPETVPSNLALVVLLNPAAYMIDVVRSTLLADYPLSWVRWSAATFVAGGTFVAGVTFFRRFKTFIVDYE